MSNEKSPGSDTETILMALDQISQTIDVMTSVVGRLRTYMQEQESLRKTQAATDMTPLDANSTVH
ncbi:MAG: hypothetical protein AAGI24_15455 [Pseudomonadota bacterium]